MNGNLLRWRQRGLFAAICCHGGRWGAMRNDNFHCITAPNRQSVESSRSGLLVFSAAADAGVEMGIQ